MSKIININPSLFSFSGNVGTRKKKPKSDLKIKVKSSMIKENNKTTKRALLKYIRNQQEKNYEKNIKSEKLDNNESNKPVDKIMSNKDTFNTDFDESLKYLTEIAEQNTKNMVPVNNMNRTLRNVSNIIPNPYTTISNNLPILDNLPPLPVVLHDVKPKKMNYPIPQYGCLKKGLLPTYRSWKNQTQKNIMHNNVGGVNNLQMNRDQNLIQKQSNQPQLIQTHNSIESIKPIDSSQSRESILDKKIKNMSEITQLSNKLKINKKPKMYYPKQKRILRRTYTVGKSKVFPKISVLVSNKTIRNNISTKTQLLKQVPINDVKKYLIKHGFIRIGTVAPNDVLRKMYESAILICGNINNHNPDNLLYNYFNDSENK